MKNPTPPRASRGNVQVGRRLRVTAVAALLLLGACGPSPAPPGSPADGGWRDFQGSWNASGTRHTVSLGGARLASLTDLTGSLLLAGPSRPGVGFRAEVIALNDSATGLIGRCVWTDENGDEVYSELRGEGTAPGNRITGTFLGGSGRYVGASGTYEFSWQYVLEAEDGTVQGRSVDVTGRIHAGQPQATPAAREVTP